MVVVVVAIVAVAVVVVVVVAVVVVVVDGGKLLDVVNKPEEGDFGKQRINLGVDLIVQNMFCKSSGLVTSKLRQFV